MKGDKIMSKKNRYKFDPMSPALGALRSFQDRLHSIGIKVERGGDGFAISAKFPYLSLSNGIENQISYRNSGSDAVGLLKQVISRFLKSRGIILIPISFCYQQKRVRRPLRLPLQRASEAVNMRSVTLYTTWRTEA